MPPKVSKVSTENKDSSCFQQVSILTWASIYSCKQLLYISDMYFEKKSFRDFVVLWFINSRQLQNPTFSEVQTVAKPPTARQQKASLNNAQKQIETMATILLDSAGLQVTSPEESKPIQI